MVSRPYSECNTCQASDGGILHEVVHTQVHRRWTTWSVSFPAKFPGETPNCQRYNLGVVLALLALSGLGLPGDKLGPPSLLTDGDAPILVDEGHGDLARFDLDGDGVQDLVIGQFKDGLIRFYKNRGTDKAPRFKGFEFLVAGGAPIKVDAG